VCRYFTGHSWLLILCFVISCTDKHTPTLRLGTNIWPGYEPLYLARHNGALEDDRVHLVELSSSTQVMQAFRNKLIDAAALTIDEAIALAETGTEFKIVLVMDISNGADGIVGQSDITNLQDIKGKVVGVENNALGAYVISRALESINLKKTDIKIIPLDIHQHEEAFTQKKVTAVVTFQPALKKLLDNGGNLLFDSSQISNEIIDVLIVRTTYLDKHPDNVQYLIDSWFKSIELFHSQPRKSAEILGVRMRLNTDDTLMSYKGLILPGREDNERLLTGQGQPELLDTIVKINNIMQSEGLLKTSIEPSTLFAGSILNYEQKQYSHDE